jgi:hypothetical protein
MVTKRCRGASDRALGVAVETVRALLVVMPVSENYLGMLRDIFPRNAKGKLGLVPIDAVFAS